jgi:SPP1 family predicted phage head-tail adaptor
MPYDSGFRHEIIIPLNRKAATVGKYGVDSGGVQWEEGTPLHANVDYNRGKRAMNAGALDAYAVKIVRMNFTDKINERSRIKYQGKIYQIMPETFNANFRDNTLQFLMQQVNDKQQTAPTPSSNAMSGGSSSSHEIG